jgi:hypothetical protein
MFTFKLVHTIVDLDLFFNELNFKGDSLVLILN